MTASEFVESKLPLTIGDRKWYVSLFRDDLVFVLIYLVLIGLGITFDILYFSGSNYDNGADFGKFLLLQYGMVWSLVQLSLTIHRKSYEVNIERDQMRIRYRHLGMHGEHCFKTKRIENVEVRKRPNSWLFGMFFDQIRFIELTLRNQKELEEHIVRFPFHLIVDGTVDPILFGIILREITSNADMNDYEQDVFGQQDMELAYRDYLKGVTEMENAS